MLAGTRATPYGRWRIPTLGCVCSTLRMRGYSKRQLVRSGISQADGQAALWGCINEQDCLFVFLQDDAQGDADGGFANVAFQLAMAMILAFFFHDSFRKLKSWRPGSISHWAGQ